jgi:carbon storage regulator
LLVVTRREGERILIGEVEIVVLETHRGSVRLGINAPKGTTVLRAEVVEVVDDPEPPLSG